MKESDDGQLYLGLLSSWTLSIIQYFKKLDNEQNSETW
jgi:hypothetical protein